MDGLTLHLELSFDVDDQDESDKYSSGSGVEVPRDIQGLPCSNYPPISFPSTEFPGNVIDVNLLYEPTSDHCDVSLDALKNTECRSSEEADQHPTPSWRWPGIGKIPKHRMPQDTSSAKRQRGDATWRRRRRLHNRPTKLHFLQVRKYKQKWNIVIIAKAIDHCTKLSISLCVFWRIKGWGLQWGSKRGLWLAGGIPGLIHMELISS